VLLLSKEVKNLFVHVKALHSFEEAPGELPLLLNLSIDVKDGKAQEVRESLSQALAQLPIPISVVTEGSKVQVGVKLPSPYQLPVD
jgi:hypothetical protein